MKGCPKESGNGKVYEESMNQVVENEYDFFCKIFFTMLSIYRSNFNFLKQKKERLGFENDWKITTI